MRVGVYGWYRYGNFGDDVMAVMLARHLRSLGHHPIVYQLPSFHADPEELATAPTIEALLEASDVCILGGGGHFCEISGVDKLDGELSKLVDHAAKKDIPLFGVSLGGDGRGTNARLSPGRSALLRSPQLRGVTLRLLADLPLLEQFEVKAEVHNDIVLLSPDFWPATGPDRRGRSGIYVQGVKAPRTVMEIHLYSLLHTGRLARHVSTTYKSQHWQSKTLARIKAMVPYTDIGSYAGLFSSAEVFFSNKLHLGVFAMAYGCPFYSFGGLPKTQVQLEELGLNANYISGKGPQSVARLVRAAREQTDSVRLLAERARTSARGHLRALEGFLANLG